MTTTDAPRVRRRTLTPSPAVHAKAAAYLLAGRVRVVAARPGYAQVHVTGTAPHPYRVIATTTATVCDCPALRTCCHTIAARLVVGIEPPPPTVHTDDHRP